MAMGLLAFQHVHGEVLANCEMPVLRVQNSTCLPAAFRANPGAPEALHVDQSLIDHNAVCVLVLPCSRSR